MVMALAMAFSLLGGVAVSAAEPNYEGSLVILHTNDVHTRVDGVGNSKGYATVAAAKKYFADAGADVLLLDVGDTLHGLPMANAFEGKTIVDIMNATAYDAMVPGNHDFNYGTARLIELAEMMDFPLLAANFTKTGETEPVFAPYELFKLENYTVGVVGLATPETAYKSSPAGLNGYDFNGDDLVEILQANIDAVIEAGADFVICVGHLGITETAVGEPWCSQDVIPQVSGLDLFIDGHSHTTLEQLIEKELHVIADKDENDVVLTSTGEYMNNIGIVTVNAEAIVADYLDNEALEITPDADVAKLVADLLDADAVANKQIVGNTAFPLEGDRAFNRTQETNSGNFGSDAFLTATGADIALLNGGNIRAALPIDHTDPEDTANYIEGAVEGDISLGDILTVFPFANTLCVIEITGQDLLDALLVGTAQTPEQSGGFPHMAGVSFELHTYIAADDTEAVRVQNVLVDGKALDLEATYTLATNNFIASGGDGYTMFAGKPYLSEHGQDYAAILAYLVETLDGVVSDDYAEPQGRITVIAEADPSFPDVKAEDWFYQFVILVAKSELMGAADNDGNFLPLKDADRAMLVTLMHRIAGKPAVEGKTSDYFYDTADDSWYSEALVWAFQNEITTGLDEKDDDGLDKFAPAQVLDRQQLVTFIYRFAKFMNANWVESVEAEELTFADADKIADWAKDAVEFAVATEIVNGKENNLFDPLGSAKRSEVAKVTVIFCELLKQNAPAETLPAVEEEVEVEETVPEAA